MALDLITVLQDGAGYDITVTKDPNNVQYNIAVVSIADPSKSWYLDLTLDQIQSAVQKQGTDKAIYTEALNLATVLDSAYNEILTKALALP